MTNTGNARDISDSQIYVMLRRVLELLDRKQAVEAEAILYQIFAVRPEEPDALQLLGTMRREQGRFSEAEQLFRKSILAKPGQPNVHQNLGNLLRLWGRFDEAIVEHREAIRLKPNYVEAYLALGVAYSNKGDRQDLEKTHDREEAEKNIRHALRLQHNSIDARLALSAVLNDLDRPAEAETVLREALAMKITDPRLRAAVEHNLGIAVAQQKRFGEALALYDAAQSKAPNLPHVDYNRASALQYNGDLDGAVQSYRRAISLNPLDLRAHRNLNHLLYRLGDDENFLKSYDQAIARHPDIGGFNLAKANFLLVKEDFQDARTEFERAAQLLPDNPAALEGLAQTLARLGNFDEAIPAHEQAIKLNGKNPNLWVNYAETLLRAQDAPKALKAAHEALGLKPEHQGAIAMIATALTVQGDEKAEAINDFTNLVRVFEIAPPKGYPNIESFNAELSVELAALHRDRREVMDQTLRGGTQTMGDLFGNGHGLVELLRARLDEAVLDYITGLGDDADHPMRRRRGKDFSYVGSWSSRLGDCGYHTNHYHAKGWISSVYYVSAPDASKNEIEKQGWIKFGEPSFDAHLRDPIRRTVQPRPGTLVLFPSYMWHGTIPFRSSSVRTTVAFDVLPK